MTLEITRPEIEARIQRYLQSGQFRDLDELLARALDALSELLTGGETPPPGAGTGQSLIDAFAEIRGLLTDEEIDRMFRRNPSTALPVDLS
jgi:hypothetical protein